MNRHGVARTIGLIVVALVIVGTLLYFAFGSSLPAPSETNRFKHPAGFSAIRPAGWIPNLQSASPDGKSFDALLFAPEKTEGRPISILVAQRSPPDQKTYDDLGFAKKQVGDLSTLHLQTEKRDRVDSYLFQIDGQWFQVVTIRHLGDHDDARWQEYVNTVRLEPKATTRAFE